MALNKQGKGGIETCEFTWNPITGCLHGCEYCYLKRIGARLNIDMMTPAYKPQLLNDLARRKKPALIFVGSSGDMFGEWVPDEQIQSVMDVVAENDRHAYQFLTKNPQRYKYIKTYFYCWYGTTCDGTKRTIENINYLMLSLPRIATKFISFEPLLHEPPDDLDLTGISWIIIGANTNRGAKKPLDEWALKLIKIARRDGAAIYIKDNYRFPLMGKYSDCHKEYPGRRICMSECLQDIKCPIWESIQNDRAKADTAETN